MRPWLLAHDLWPALQPSLAALALRLEPAGAWPGPGEAPVDPVLQHLRRALLLRMLDAGPESRRNVEVSGQWQLLLDTEPIPGLPAALIEHWQSELRMAFCTHELPGDGGKQRGRDLRERHQAGAMLGELGDNIRYERRAVGKHWGLRLRDALWATVGRPGELTKHLIGSPPEDALASEYERPVCETPPMPCYQVARLPVTVGEWRRFAEAEGYADVEALHWRAAGSAAQEWLRRSARPYQLPAMTRAACNQTLQPMCDITVYEAVAYAAWISGAAAFRGANDSASVSYQVPNELQWEAAMRCDVGGQPPQHHHIWLHQPGNVAPGALDFNYAKCGLGLTAVGLFSRGYSQAGLADGSGNVWDWCCNAVPAGGLAGWGQPGAIEVAQLPWAPEDSDSLRSLRGGAFAITAGHCRPAFRILEPAAYFSGDIGLRLVHLV